MPYNEAAHTAARAAALTRGILDWILALLGILGMGVLVYAFGWPLNVASETLLYGLADYMMLVFGLSELTLLAIAGNRLNHVRENALSLTAAVPAIMVSLCSERVLHALGGNALGGHNMRWALLTFVIVTQLAVLLPLLLKWLRRGRRTWMTKVQPRALVIGSFFSLILIGALLLMTPNATSGGIRWLDALFTSTSAVCVTGLTVMDTATQFTRHGQFVILVLIQAGGLGLMTFTFFLAMLSGEGISLHDRVLLRDMLSERNLGFVSRMLLEIVLLTLTVELGGTLAIWFCWQGHTLPGGTLWQSLFHSVSAFCNAGFSILSGNLADPQARGLRSLQAAIMSLVILGGLGFPVLRELRQRALSYIFPKRYQRSSHMSLHTRIVLTMTGILLVGGTLLLFICQYAGPEGVSPSLWRAMFDSVTARTAGFNISDVGMYTAPVAMVLILLMFIGGSPAGTAGGIKTTTFALALLNLWTIVRDKKEIQVGWRSVSQHTANQAFAVLVISLGWIALSIFAMTIAEPTCRFLDLVFETVSAFGTVGLSRGITASLGDPAKLIITATMFIGRIGLIVIANALLHAHTQTHYSLPKEQVSLT